MDSEAPKPESGEPRGLLVTALLVILIWGVAQSGPFLIPILLAGVLAFLMAPLVSGLGARRVPESVGIAIAALMVVLPFIGLGYMIFNQGQSLARDFPSIARAVRGWITAFAASPLGVKLHAERLMDLSLVGERILSGAGQGLSIVIAGIGAVLNAGSKVALILVFAVAMVASRRHLRRSAEKIIATHRSFRGRQAPDLLNEIVALVQRFLLARSLIVVIIGLADFAILGLFGVSYAFLLGSFLGIMTLIPAVGFIIGLTPTLLVAIATGHSIFALLGILACLIVTSIIESNVLTPGMVGRRLNINALSTFLGFFAGGLLWGVWGMFLSIPALGVLRIVFSAVPGLEPWGELLAERSDREPRFRLPLGPEPPAPEAGEERERARTAAWSLLPFRKRAREERHEKHLE